MQCSQSPVDTEPIVSSYLFLNDTFQTSQYTHWSCDCRDCHMSYFGIVFIVLS